MKPFKWKVTKTYGNDRGYSVAFRQWRAKETHCSLIHGYALGFEVEVVGNTLDHRNWLYSFGEFKSFKQWLDDNFDHVTHLPWDDPLRTHFEELAAMGGLKLCLWDAVGCEAFAEAAFRKLSEILGDKYPTGSVWVHSVKVFEHGANAVTYYGDVNE